VIVTLAERGSNVCWYSCHQSLKILLHSNLRNKANLITFSPVIFLFSDMIRKKLIFNCRKVILLSATLINIHTFRVLFMHGQFESINQKTLYRL